MSNNIENLIMWHLRVVPIPEVYFIPEKKASLMKQALKNCINETGLSQGHVAVPPDPLSPGPSTSSTNKTPENINKDPDDLNQHRKEISK